MSREYTRLLVHALLGTVVTLCMAAPVLAQDVSYNAMPGADFAKFKTYKWVAIEGAEKPHQIVDQQIKQAVDTQLAAKGLTKSTGDAADLLGGYQVAVNQERQWDAYGTGMVRVTGWAAASSTATSSTISIGTLGIDIYDSAAKQLVWRGSATNTFI